MNRAVLQKAQGIPSKCHALGVSLTPCKSFSRHSPISHAQHAHTLGSLSNPLITCTYLCTGKLCGVSLNRVYTTRCCTNDGVNSVSCVLVELFNRSINCLLLCKRAWITEASYILFGSPSPENGHLKYSYAFLTPEVLDVTPQ